MKLNLWYPLKEQNLKKVSTLFEFILEVFHCEETFGVYNEASQTEQKLFEDNNQNQQDDRLTQMKRRRDKKNDKLGIKNNVNGFLVPPNDQKLLQESIKKLIVDSKLRN